MATHRHLLINAQIEKTINTDNIVNFLTFFVDQINMSIIEGPFVNEKENGEVAVAVILEDSHVAFYTVDDQFPIRVQFDVYYWKQFDLVKLINLFKEYFHVQEVSSIRMLGRFESSLCLVDKVKPGWMDNYLNSLEISDSKESEDYDVPF